MKSLILLQNDDFKEAELVLSVPQQTLNSGLGTQLYFNILYGKPLAFSSSPNVKSCEVSCKLKVIVTRTCPTGTFVMERSCSIS